MNPQPHHDSLKSPTCADCAMAHGFIPVVSVATVYQGKCANCLQNKPVSTANDWTRPGTRSPLWD